MGSIMHIGNQQILKIGRVMHNGNQQILKLDKVPFMPLLLDSVTSGLHCFSPKSLQISNLISLANLTTAFERGVSYLKFTLTPK